jgi:hypothetical protein
VSDKAWSHAGLSLSATPPSLNSMGTRGSRHIVTRAKQAWQEDLGRMLKVIRQPRDLQEVHATAVLRFPSRRDRDEGNFRWLLEKALGDALVPRYLPEDTPDHYRFKGVDFDPERGPALTVVTLAYR